MQHLASYVSHQYAMVYDGMIQFLQLATNERKNRKQNDVYDNNGGATEMADITITNNK